MKNQTWEYQYLNLLKKVLEEGERREDRTGVGTRSLFGQRLDINLQEGFPAVTTKKLAWKSMLTELIWFIEGSGDERRLAEILHGTRDKVQVKEEILSGEVVKTETQLKTIWTDNAEADYWKPKAKFEGDLGRIYGKQWRSWNKYVQITSTNAYEVITVDQLQEAINKIRNNPTDRRIIVSAWNVGELDQMALPPCHMFFQFYVSNDRTLSMQVYMRSIDLCLGLPFNIASYAALLHLIAAITGCKPGRLIMDLGDCHIYNNHIEQVREQLSRKPFDPPTIQLAAGIDLNFAMSDMVLQNYKHHDAIKASMAV